EVSRPGGESTWLEAEVAGMKDRLAHSDKDPGDQKTRTEAEGLRKARLLRKSMACRSWMASQFGDRVTRPALAILRTPATAASPAPSLNRKARQSGSGDSRGSQVVRPSCGPSWRLLGGLETVSGPTEGGEAGRCREVRKVSLRRRSG